MTHSTAFEPGKGLIVTLYTELLDAHLGGGIIAMICTSLDITTNPIPAPNPYDFTIPKRS